MATLHRIGIAGFHQFDAGGAMMQGLPPVVPRYPGNLKEVADVALMSGHSFTPVAFYGVKSLTQDMGTLIPSGLMGPVHLEMLR